MKSANSEAPCDGTAYLLLRSAGGVVINLLRKILGTSNFLRIFPICVLFYFYVRVAVSLPLSEIKGW